MRTTLSIDDDVLEAVKERAEREGTTAGAVLSELARRALTSATASAGHAGDAAPTRSAFPQLPSRGGLVTNALVDRLRDEDPDA